MSPPSYADLGKSARDLFSKGYTFGFLKLDTTTKSGDQHPLEFKTSASHNTATGKLFGTVDLKYKFPKYGITLTEKWNTDNVLGTEIAVEDQGVKGLKCTFESSFAPQLGKRTGRLKAEFKHERFNLGGDISLDSAPILNGALVVEHKGILVGAQTGFDTQRSKVTHTGLALGYQVDNYALHTFVNDNSEFGGNLYHKVNDRLELAANLGWTTGDSATRFGVGAKYLLERGTYLQTKVSNNSQVAVSLTHNLNENFKLTLSTLVNMQNFQEGGHKYGVGLEYTPSNGGGDSKRR